MQDNRKISKLSDLRYARGPLLWINLITLYRTVTFPLLIILLITDRVDIFRWLLIVSFLTDSVDGFLARGYKVNSVLGARMDSIGDDLTVLAGVVGLVMVRWEFLVAEWLIFAVPFVLFLIQVVAALIQYGQISSFHTYLAKLAAVLQGLFICSMFLWEDPIHGLFYAAAAVTSLELVEEIFIVIALREWKTNVHGLYWALKERGRPTEDGPK